VLDNKRFPAGLIVVLGGRLTGLLLGARVDLEWGSFGFHLPDVLPVALPGTADFIFALFALVLPQLPNRMYP